MAKVKQAPSEFRELVDPRVVERIFYAVLAVIEKSTRKTEVHVELDGKKYLAAVYRLNDAVPARVDFKASK